LGLNWQRTVRWDQTEAPVRSITVVMIDEDLDRVLKMPRVQAQEPVQTLGPNGPHEPFGDPVRLRGLWRRPNDPHVLGLEHRVEAAHELAIAVANQKPNRLLPLDERPGNLPRLLRDPHVVGLRGAAGEVPAAAA